MGFRAGRSSSGPWSIVAPFSSSRPSIRARGSPGHGLPTPFTAGIRSLPPRLALRGRDDDSIQADQAELVGREVEQCPLAEVSTTTVPFADEQRDTHPCVRPNLAEALSRVPILEVPDPTAQEL